MTSSHSGFSPNTQSGAQVLSQQGQICVCYVAMAAPQDSTPAPTFMPASHVVSEALKYKAQAAELHAEAARLKAEAFQYEALAHASTPECLLDSSAQCALKVRRRLCHQANSVCLAKAPMLARVARVSRSSQP